MKKTAISIFSALLFFCVTAKGSENFQITDIHVEGLTRIPAETVFDYLSVGIGDEFDETLGQQLVRVWTLRGCATLRRQGPTIFNRIR